MLDLRFILIIVLIICGNVNLTFGKKKNIRYKSCDAPCETGRCYYKDCKENSQTSTRMAAGILQIHDNYSCSYRRGNLRSKYNKNKIFDTLGTLIFAF